jgi:hypothetical protein
MRNRLIRPAAVTLLALGCASPPRLAKAPSGPKLGVRSVGSVLARCGMPGRERCDPEPTERSSAADTRRLACAEACAKSAMEGHGVIAASSLPDERRRSERADVQQRLLACFGSCDARAATFATANMPPGVVPCSLTGASENATTCLMYECHPYGDEKYMLPVSASEGEACVIPSSGGPGTCRAGSCVPADAYPEACSASTIQGVISEWLGTVKVQIECTSPGTTRPCYPRPLGSEARSLLLGHLDCKTSWEQRHARPPAVFPWGHWPVSVSPEAK